MEIVKCIIGLDNCNGEENEFAEWIRNNHPEIEVEMANASNGGGYFDENGDMVDKNEPGYVNLWREYCSS